MIDDNLQLEPACRDARERIHRSLDGDRPDVADRDGLETHLDGCRDCREFLDDLRVIQHGLRGLSGAALPAGVLDDVWQQTSRGVPAVAGSARRGRGWRRFAAAAVVLLGVFGVWQLGTDTVIDPSETELKQAAIDARVALRLTANALNRTKTVAVRDVLEAEVSGALRRTPIRWPGATESGRNGS